MVRASTDERRFTVRGWGQGIQLIAGDTGEGAAIQQLANKGFLLSAATSTGGSADEPIIHSNRFVLVDRQARIRGYYDGTDAESVKLLLRDIKKLYREVAS